MQVRARLSSFAKAASVAVHLPRFVGPGPENSLTTLLFHRFFLPDETLEAGRERLRRRLQWLREEYSPLTPAEAMDGLAKGTLPKFAALVTTDDANVDFFKVEDVFKSFEVPVLMFVCVGWSDISGPPETRSLLARIVALLQWGAPADQDIPLRRGFSPVRLAEQHRAGRAKIIDEIIAAREELQPELEDLALRLEPAVNSRTCCNWRELKDLSNAGTFIGCHSVSHIPLAKASDVRMRFEIEEARNIILSKFGSCQYFAYPFGNPGSFSAATTAEIKRTGFECAFLTHADFATGQTDKYHLPRLVIPEEGISLTGFRAIVRGGGIPLEKAKRLIAKKSI